jgi:arylsulfatase
MSFRSKARRQAQGRVDFVHDGGGRGKAGTVVILLDGTEVAKVRVLKTIPFRFSIEETLDFSEDTGIPVDISYDLPQCFTSDLGKTIIELK